MTTTNLNCAWYCICKKYRKSLEEVLTCVTNIMCPCILQHCSEAGKRYVALIVVDGLRRESTTKCIYFG